MAVTGVLVVAHGGGPDWDGPVLEVVAGVSLDEPVEAAFLFPRSRDREIVARLERLRERGAERVVVVPLLVSSHSGHYAMAGQAARGAAGGLEVAVTGALDGAPELAEVLADRAAALATAPGEQAVHVVGHGPNAEEDYRRWMDELEPVAGAVRERGGFADARIGLVRDDAPAAVRSGAVESIRASIRAQHEATARPVVVVPLLVSVGFLSTDRLPGDLSGLAIAYDPTGLAPHPALARWVERRVREAGVAA